MVSSPAFRPVQMVVSALLGLYVLLVAFNNTLDYGTNYLFVEKVLGMEDTFRNGQEWRAIAWKPLVHGFYALIILLEGICAVLCLSGAYRMLQRRNASEDLFQIAKTRAVMGVLLGFTLWTGVFLCGGGEWFLMWQSKVWNGQDIAIKLAILYGIGLGLLR